MNFALLRKFGMTFLHPQLNLPQFSPRWVFWGSEAGWSAQEKLSSGKHVLKSKVLKGQWQGCHSGWMNWQSHFQAYQIMFHLSEYFCFTSVHQHKLSCQHQEQDSHFHSTKGFHCAFYEVSLLVPLPIPFLECSAGLAFSCFFTIYLNQWLRGWCICCLFIWKTLRHLFKIRNKPENIGTCCIQAIDA